MTEYKCPFPGCGRISNSSAACKHGDAFVSMKVNRIINVGMGDNDFSEKAVGGLMIPDIWNNDI